MNSKTKLQTLVAERLWEEGFTRTFRLVNMQQLDYSIMQPGMTEALKESQIAFWQHGDLPAMNTQQAALLWYQNPVNCQNL